MVDQGVGMTDNLDILRAVTQVMARQRHQRCEEVRQSLMSDTVPVSQTVLDDLAWLNREDAISVLRDHPGFKKWQRWNSYQAALVIFEQSIQDLFSAIDDLTDQSRNKDLFSRPFRQRLDAGNSGRSSQSRNPHPGIAIRSFLSVDCLFIIVDH